MKKKLRILLISLLMLIGSILQISFAQDFQVTPAQLKQTNLLFNKLEYLEKQDSLSKVLIQDLSQMNKVLQIQDSLHVEGITILNQIVTQKEESILKLENQYANKEKQYKVATGFAIGGGATSTCLLLLLILLL